MVPELGRIHRLVKGGVKGDRQDGGSGDQPGQIAAPRLSLMEAEPKDMRDEALFLHDFSS